MKKAIPIALAVLVVSAIAIGVWLWRVADRSASMSYSLAIFYRELPGDDLKLKSWLMALPGFRTGDVSRDGKKVELHFELHDPQPADVFAATLKQAEALGYRDPTGYSGRFGRKKAFDFQTFRVEYETLPADDQTLLAWLAEQRGLRSSRVSRQGRVIELELVSTDPPVPTLLGDILRQCRSIGYEEQVGYVSGYGPYR